MSSIQISSPVVAWKRCSQKDASRKDLQGAKSEETRENIRVVKLE